MREIPKCTASILSQREGRSKISMVCHPGTGAAARTNLVKFDIRRKGLDIMYQRANKVWHSARSSLEGSGLASAFGFSSEGSSDASASDSAGGSSVVSLSVTASRG